MSETAVSLGRKQSIKAKRRPQVKTNEEVSSSSSTVAQPPVEEAQDGQNLHLKKILEIDTEDDAMVRTKRELLGDFESLAITPGEKAKLDLIKLTIICESENVKHDYNASELGSIAIRIKEDVEFDIILDVKVSNDLLLGLRYSHILKKMGIEVDKVSEMIGSYPPKREVQQLRIKNLQAPKGLLGRGRYAVSAALTDDDEVTHKEWDWTLKVAKKWGERGEDDGEE